MVRTSRHRGPVLRVRGLEDFIAALRRLSRDIARDDEDWKREAADRMAGAARRAAGSRLAPSISSGVRRGRAELTIRPQGSYADALVRFVGATRRTGWYGAPQYSRSGQRQHPPWLGQGWDFPDMYIIGPALNRMADRVPVITGDYIDDIAKRRAFPD